MIQRLIYTVLTEGLADLVTDTRIVDRLFRQGYGLGATEADAIQTFFSGEKKPTVRHGYAPTDAKFPLYAIVLNDERESDSFIGDDGGPVFTGEDAGANIKTAIWQHNYHVLCYAQHPDAVLYMYEVAKSIFLHAATTLEVLDEGIYFLSLSGNDVRIADDLVPSQMFGRTLHVGIRREFQHIDLEAIAGRIRQVRGVHVDNPASPGDVVGVTPKVHVTVEDP